MEALFIFALVAAVAWLTGRLRDAERRLGHVEAEQAGLLEMMRSVRPAPVMPERELQPEAAPLTRNPVRASVPRTVTPFEPATIDAAPKPGDPVGAAPAPEAEPTLEDSVLEHQEETRAPFRLDLEDIFGRRLPIWAGGIALAISGVFLVRYSIERGLITPLLRVVMAFLFGFGLIGGAEAAYRFRERVADPRVGQALAGAGLATLYAAFYLAGTQYGLIGQTLAFLGLAAVTAGAIGLSFRFGLPSAVLGLVGGFAAPVMVGGDEANLPLLSLYLGLVTAGLVVSGRRQQRPWMGMTALAGGLGWGAMLLLSGDFGYAEVMALGLYFVVLGAVLPALAGVPQFERPLRLGAALIASLQLALLVDQAGYSPLVWALYLLLGATLAFFGWRRAEVREGNAVAATLAVILLAQWDGANGPVFAAVAAGIAGVFAIVPAWLVRRGEDRPVDGWQVAGVATGLAAVTFATFSDFAHDRAEPMLASATLALALLPGFAGWVMRRREDATGLAIQVAASAALVFAAFLLVTPGWMAPLAGAAVFGAVFFALSGRAEFPLHKLLWSSVLVVGLALAAHYRIADETAHLWGWDQDTRDALGLLRWAAFAAVLGAMAWREHALRFRRFAEGAAVVALYGALAQVLPRDLLAWTAAAFAIGVHFLLRERPSAALAAAAVALAWAVEPLGWWLGAGLASLGGHAVLLGELPSLADVALRLLPAAAALSFTRLRLSLRWRDNVPIAAGAVPLAVVIGHIAFKHLFAISDVARFTEFGLAERTVWEALLLGTAWIVATGIAKIPPRRDLAFLLACAAVGHFALYTGLLHNPLWTLQALGPVPLANLGLAAYGLAIATVLSLRRWSPARLAPVWDGAAMVLASLLALTLLRHAFAGSLPAPVPMGQTEDLLRSLAGILLALGFLWLGSKLGERSWRAGSLAIMLVAVAKVFLVDAAGLDGLLRVVSFMALGFSLIGIGWIYSRQLRARPPA